MKAPSGLVAVIQFLVSMYQMPATMKASTIATLMMTMTLFTLADSRVPTTSKVEMAAMMNMAGTLSTAPVWDQRPVAAS